MMLVGALAAAGAASAQESSPTWLKKPTPKDLVAVWPREAMRAGLGGQAVISCTATVQGTLRDCTVVSETPTGSGFGAAALVLTQQFLMKPAVRDGKPVESTVKIPITFADPGGPAAPGGRKTGSRLPANPDDTPSGDLVATNLAWREAPTFADVLAAFPEKARAEKVSGVVALDCRLEEGRLDGCRTIREEPRGHGFAGAARKLAPRFLGPTKGPDGKPLERMRTHLTFAFPAEALDKPQPVIGRPRWVGLPTLEDMTAVLPEAARKANIYKARVVMSCTVVAGGRLDPCQVKSEEPAGLGYGQAALSLSGAFVLNTWTQEGLPTVGGSVQVPIRFDLEAEVQDPAPQ